MKLQKSTILSKSLRNLKPMKEKEHCIDISMDWGDELSSISSATTSSDDEEEDWVMDPSWVQEDEDLLLLQRTKSGPILPKKNKKKRKSSTCATKQKQNHDISIFNTNNNLENTSVLDDKYIQDFFIKNGLEKTDAKVIFQQSEEMSSKINTTDVNIIKNHSIQCNIEQVENNSHFIQQQQEKQQQQQKQHDNKNITTTNSNLTKTKSFSSSPLSISKIKKKTLNNNNNNYAKTTIAISTSNSSTKDSNGNIKKHRGESWRGLRHYKDEKKKKSQYNYDKKEEKPKEDKKNNVNISRKAFVEEIKQLHKQMQHNKPTQSPKRQSESPSFEKSNVSKPSWSIKDLRNHFSKEAHVKENDDTHKAMSIGNIEARNINLKMYERCDKAKTTEF